MNYLKLTALLTMFFCLMPPAAGAAGKLTVGVTLHAYYSWVANIAGDTIELVTVIPPEVDPHSYQPRPQDLAKLEKMAIIVVNTLGHDDYITGMLKAAGQEKIRRIEANQGVPLIPAVLPKHASKEPPDQIAYNSHTYVSILTAIQQINTIAEELGKVLPSHATLYRQNASSYGRELRKMLRTALRQLQQKKRETITIATVHDGYAYLFSELGIKTDAVIQPRHGIEPSARQLADTIKRINKAGANVLFTEVDYQKKYVETIYQETGCRLYQLSHISNGAYTADKFSRDMQANLDTIVRALSAEGAEQ